MIESKISTFEVILLVVGIAAGLWGFLLINEVFDVEREVSWLMMIAVFNWLILLILFISLSLAVDISRKQYNEVVKIIGLLEKRKGRK